ncbi:MAG: hypothetical protein SOT81_09195, partial [Treponema sp.]|nr:hypothetical protein [Treponema sp.]
LLQVPAFASIASLRFATFRNGFAAFRIPNAKQFHLNFPICYGHLTKLRRKCQERILFPVYPDDVLRDYSVEPDNAAARLQINFKRKKDDGMAYGDEKVNCFYGGSSLRMYFGR